MKSSKPTPGTKPAEKQTSNGASGSHPDKPASNGKASSKRSAQQGEKKTTP